MKKLIIILLVLSSCTANMYPVYPEKPEKPKEKTVGALIVIGTVIAIPALIMTTQDINR